MLNRREVFKSVIAASLMTLVPHKAAFDAADVFIPEIAQNKQFCPTVLCHIYYTRHENDQIET